MLLKLNQILLFTSEHFLHVSQVELLVLELNCVRRGIIAHRFVCHELIPKRYVSRFVSQIVEL